MPDIILSWNFPSKPTAYRVFFREFVSFNCYNLTLIKWCMFSLECFSFKIDHLNCVLFLTNISFWNWVTSFKILSEFVVVADNTISSHNNLVFCELSIESWNVTILTSQSEFQRSWLFVNNLY